MTFVLYMGYFLLDLRQLAAFPAILCMRKEIQFFTRVLLAFLIEVSRTRLSARMWSILTWPVWADGGCCERDSIRSLLLYTLCSVFFCILYSVWYVIALRYIWHAISFDLVPHFQLWVWPSCSAASAANACQEQDAQMPRVACAERGTPRSLRLLHTYCLLTHIRVVAHAHNQSMLLRFFSCGSRAPSKECQKCLLLSLS